jgi:predicted AlkP superfamily pyrophosphatase or phosphodiesterase
MKNFDSFIIFHGLYKYYKDIENDELNWYNSGKELIKLPTDWEEFRIKNCYTLDDFAAQYRKDNYSLYIVRAYSNKENINISVMGNVPEERLLEIPQVINYLRLKQ